MKFTLHGAKTARLAVTCLIQTSRLSLLAVAVHVSIQMSHPQALQGQDNLPTRPTEENSAKSSATSQLFSEVIYGHKAGLALTYDVIRPAKDDNKAAVIFVVSGGWNSTYFDPKQFKRMALLAKLSDRGYTLFLVRHGSAPRFKVPEAVADIRQAVQHVQSNANNYGIDPKRLGICGASAGGHLSLMIGTTADSAENGGESSDEKGETRVACVAAYFPPTDLRGMVGPSDRFPALDFDKDLGDDVSPILHVTEDDAPTLLVHGTKDRLVPIRHSEKIKAEFDNAGVACEFLKLEGAGHGFRGQQARQAEQAVLNWFEEYLLK